MFEAVQVRAPVAVPEAPAAVDQVTDVTPALSEASPWNVMVLAVVDTIVEAGFVICSVGGVVFEPGCGPEGVLGLVGEAGVDGEVGADGIAGVSCAC